MIGKNLRMGNFNVIEEGATIGNDVRIENSVEIQKGAIIGDGCWVRSFSRIGVQCVLDENVIVKCGAVLGPRCHLKKGSFIGPKAVMTSDTTSDPNEASAEIGCNAFIGASAVLMPRVVVGDNATVGALTFVNKNVEAGCTVVGSPMRVIRQAPPTIEDSPLLSVAIPMYTAGKVGWLALEGLCRQKTNFPWELLIAEEQTMDAMGQDRVMKYQDKLAEAGCVKIGYQPLKDWIPLAQKWRMLARNADPKSMAMVCHSADSFSYPDRLQDTLAVMKDIKVDWAAYKVVPFYIIPTGEVYLVDHDQLNDSRKMKHIKKLRRCGAGFAVRMKWAKRLPMSDRARGVDGWMFGAIEEMVKHEEKRDIGIHYLDAEGVLFGFNTHGLGCISKNRYPKFKERYQTKNSLVTNWPKEVMEKLKRIRNDAKL